MTEPILEEAGHLSRLGQRPMPVLLACALVVLVPSGAVLPESLAETAVPTTPCTTKDTPETGLQGQVSIEDQQSGRSAEGYCENVRLIGQNDIQGRGMNGNLGWIGSCAYVAKYFGLDDPLGGMAVIDARNPRNPRLVKVFRGTPETRESQVEANEARGMVVVMPFRSGSGPTQLQIYDASKDCRKPVRVGTYDFGEVVTHEHRISADGNTIFATVNSAQGDALHVIDVSDMANPELLLTWDPAVVFGQPDLYSIHDLEVNADGTRAYLVGSVISGIEDRGMAILDTTEITKRRPDPTISLIGSIAWPAHLDQSPTAGSHSAQLAHIGDRTYIIAMDEVFNTTGCPWGWTRIIDITDEANPVQVSTFNLEINTTLQCLESTQDEAMYSSHYLGVDSVKHTTMVFFTWYSSGLRVVDIRDPAAPVEIGYYNPPARSDTRDIDTSATRYANTGVDYTYSFVRYVPKTRDIWFTSIYNGFQIVRLVQAPGELPQP